MTPELLVVVDTEEEFDWTRPFSRDETATRSVRTQLEAHQIYDRYGVVPTYVVDYPVASDPRAVDGYVYVQKALRLAGSNAEMEFAASLMQQGEVAAAHRQRAVAGAPAGSLLAKNLKARQ